MEEREWSCGCRSCGCDMADARDAAGLRSERDAALKRVAEMEARVADVWREGYEAAMQTSGFGDEEWDDEGVNPYRVRP